MTRGMVGTLGRGSASHDPVPRSGPRDPAPGLYMDRAADVLAALEGGGAVTRATS